MAVDRDTRRCGVVLDAAVPGRRDLAEVGGDALGDHPVYNGYRRHPSHLAILTPIGPTCLCRCPDDSTLSYRFGCPLRELPPLPRHPPFVPAVNTPTRRIGRKRVSMQSR